MKIENLLSTIVYLVRTPFFQDGKTSSNLVSAAPYVNKLNGFKLCIISGLCKTLKSWKGFWSVKIGSSIGEMTERHPAKMLVILYGSEVRILLSPLLIMNYSVIVVIRVFRTLNPSSNLGSSTNYDT